MITSRELSPADLEKIQEAHSRASSREAGRNGHAPPARGARTESLPLKMVDASGADLGPLPSYDRHLGPQRVVQLVEEGLRGERSGVGTITFSISQLYLDDVAGPGPSAVLHVRVRD